VKQLMILLATALPLAATAQEYPTKSIRVLVSFAPGGVVDTSTRIVTSKITEALNWQFVVDPPGRQRFHRRVGGGQGECRWLHLAVGAHR
jgi:tripartite-type tricarboxylate transporter receptor subunit TctC